MPTPIDTRGTELPHELGALIKDKQTRAVDERALRTLFLEARTVRDFLPQAVPHELLERILDVAELGPTSANSSPMRIVFVESSEAKERLRPTLMAGNVEKTMHAPVTAIIAMDRKFYENLPRLFPQADMRSLFLGEEAAERARHTAFLNACLQGAYFIVVARAFGLDLGPMAGFDNAQVDREFLAGTGWESLFLLTIGYGDDTKLGPRNPRLHFNEVARIV
ncbi:MAG TPA: malonic semialdehyde reductase [Candidatus Baltobacteraceae bacterium]|jgi:3-hydroxypropanoate dehydrogenase|nr:malonic semialdehyde reductase [Candidatus Baltobacteraceae bacterium]